MFNDYTHLDAVVIPIIICDNKGKVKYVNNAFRTTKYSHSSDNELLNQQSVFTIFTLNENQKSEFKKVINNELNNITIILDTFQLLISKIKRNRTLVQIFKTHKDFNTALHMYNANVDSFKNTFAPFFSAFDLLDDLIHITDKDGCIIYANKALNKLYGDIKGQYCYSVFSKYDNYCPDCKMSLVINGSTIRYEAKLEKNGQYYDIINSPFIDFDGNIYKISIMRNLEEIIDKQNTLLLFQNAINRSRNLVSFFKENGEISYANDTFIQYFGEQYKKDINFLKLINCTNDELFYDVVDKEISLTLNNNLIFLKIFIYPIHSSDNEIIFVFIASDITNLKKLEKQLAVERNYFKSIIDNTIDGFFVINKNHNLIDCNPAFLKMFDLSYDNFKNIRMEDLFDSQYKKDFDKKINYLNKTGISRITEVSHTKNGFKNYIISLNKLTSSEIDDAQYYGFVKDITDITRLHKIIENERNYNRRIIETVQLGFVVINEFGEIIDYNNAFLDLIGCNGKNVKGEIYKSFIIPVSRDIMENFNVVSSNNPIEFEAIIQSSDNNNKNVIISMSKLYDILGNYLGNFAFIRDITHQKKIENEILYQTNKVIELVNSLTQFTANVVRIDTIDNLLFAISSFIQQLINPDYTEIFINNNTIFVSHKFNNGVHTVNNTEISQKTSFVVQKLTKNKTILYISNPLIELNDEDQLHFKNILEFQKIILIPIFIGDELKVILLSAFKTNEEKIDNVILTILTGVTNLLAITLEKIISVAEQNKMREALDRYDKLVAIGRIIAGVAHEINNPLSIMQLDIAELNQKLQGDEYDNEIRDIIKSLFEEIQRISNIVKQLKDYSKPATLNDDIINLNEIFRTYPLKILSKNIQKKGIPIVINVPKQKIFIKMPLTRLIQVIMNLLTNAEDAVIEKGEGSIIITISQIQKDDICYACLSIQDTGIGIDEENMPLIFEPFFTTKPKEGTGLGLSISYSIIKSYNGEIEINSKKNMGTTVSVLLPAYKK